MSRTSLCLLVLAGCVLPAGAITAADFALPIPSRSIAELKPTAVLQLGKTADWVAISAAAVWVGSTGPNAVHHIDPRTNKLIATVELNGEPCSGLAVGFGSVWIPLCGKPSTLAKVDAARNVVSAVFPVGPAGSEGGVTTSTDSVWLITDKNGSLARIDPDTGTVRQTVRVPAGSYNPRFHAGRIWVTRADGAQITAVDANTGSVLGTTKTGPGPRFLASGAGSIWTLNQGDGTLTRVDSHSRQATRTIVLGTPGHGGDIAFGAGLIWTTMWKVPLSAVDTTDSKLLCQWVGPGGDSLGIGHEAIWLTDYHGGTISRLELQDAVSHCRQPPG
ncbi:MAG TPA: PQQ-binding-like beta-propeller repeat protein [Steroidobacteraceae bacterium]|nr:PQQ-binding-like beta-propeller repeat protein [Steroidobacteraceae bacterium]